ncbi:MAG: SGNH/GDSL hydrolase family protein [Planctomycetota bacterium]
MWIVAGLVLVVTVNAVADAEGRGALDEGLVFFGDSLVDVGNTYMATGQAVPPSPYWAGRFSDGPVWVEHLAEALGQPAPTPAWEGGNNFAFGGSQTADALGPVSNFADLDEQVAMYTDRQDGPGRRSRHDLHVIWSGANDFLLGGQTDPGVPVDNLATELQNLYDAGARQMLVANMPPLGQVPLIRETPAAPALDAAAHQYNILLEQALQEIEAEHQDLRLYRMDVAAAVQSVLDQPEAFGFVNTTDPALGSVGIFDPQFDPSAASPVPDAEEYLFWDGAHPTAAMHELLADVAMDSLDGLLPPGQFSADPAAAHAQATVPEPASMTTLLLLAGGGELIRRRRSRR